MESLILQSLVPDDELMVRKSVSYRPRVGADYFIQHGQSVTPTSEECDTRIKERAAELMEQIRSMSMDPTDILQTMNLVDSIQLLGLDYRFEKEISEAWDMKVVHQLPEYMKDYYLKLIHTFEEFEDLLASGEKYHITYLKEVVQMKDLSKAYFEESKWRDQRYVPTLEEHLRVSLISAAYPMLECASFVGMGEIATKEAFEWITSFPKIVQASAIISRIMDDITSHELEQTRAHVASTVQCYMKEHGTNVQVACKKLQDLVEDAWKDIN
ncbi:alpha-humulene synthase-like [Musa acuminata AAA Group]|uniref:alpha-humulene synthase-like n=1 Tax=Musa acuminata AAA Group TaxID=214697 RepID=UPI0031D998A1